MWWVQVPGEVWLQVFSYLSPADRLRVRAVCTAFLKLLDGSRLFRDRTLRLTRARSVYNPQFWRTLRRWRVSAAVVSSKCSWRRVGAELPHLTCLIIDGDSDTALDSLRSFSNLQHLYLRRPRGVALTQLFRLLPPRLQLLSVCGYHDDRTPPESVLSLEAAARLTELTSLVCHCSFSVPLENVLHSLLSALPRLLLLSVRGPALFGSGAGGAHGERLQHRSLTRLEVVGYGDVLPDHLMKMVPCVRTLVLVFDARRPVDHPELGLWLRDLPGLSALTVVGGPRVSAYVRSLPPSLTRLTLRPSRITAAELKALSERVPDLQDLSLDPRVFLGPDTDLVPRLFPGLRSLCLRHEQVPEPALLRLTALTELRRLQTLDPLPLPPALAAKVRELSQNRVQVYGRPEPDPRTCSCKTAQGLNQD